MKIQRRKIIQISSMQGNDNYRPALFFLCDDGTVWSGIANKIISRVDTTEITHEEIAESDDKKESENEN